MGKSAHHHPHEHAHSPATEANQAHEAHHHDEHHHAEEHEQHSHAHHDHEVEAHAHPHHDHDHSDHHHDHDEHHHHGEGWLSRIFPFFHGHSHGEVNIDHALETSTTGIKTLKLSLGILLGTAVFQLVIVLISGSVALLADTIHNFSDAFTAIPLWIAFALNRRGANRRYTYGYGKLEDIAGVVIVLMIFASALVAAYESYQKIINPQPLSNLGWVIAASLIGFAGNELVANLRIRTGKAIGSAALVADGQHARVDGLTSLAVFAGALGVLAGFPLADPIVGLGITIAILFIVKDTAIAVWHRLTDAVEPELVDQLENAAGRVPGVLGVKKTRVRWHGHKLHAELQITVNGQLPTLESHRLAEVVRHNLFHLQPHLALINVHVDPFEHSHEDFHSLTAHHGF